MSIEASKLDFTRLACNVMTLAPKQDPAQAFEMIGKYEEFTEPLPGINRKKVIIYIVLVYDKGSPLHDLFKDPFKKKMYAAELSNFIKDDTGEYSEAIHAMMRCEDKMINAMILRYITLFHSASYNRYMLFKELEHREAINLLNGQTKIDEYNKISKELEKCEEAFLSGDTMLKPDLSRYYFQDKLELRPEDIALRISNGLKPIELKEAIPAE